jgi:hypothetical protein
MKFRLLHRVIREQNEGRVSEQSVTRDFGSTTERAREILKGKTLQMEKHCNLHSSQIIITSHKGVA